jgi:hypothetical protein
VLDLAGNSATVSKSVTAYDQVSGNATGSGWFVSRAGSYSLRPAYSGIATCTFSCRYLPGTYAPSGFLSLQVSDLRFASTSCDRLTVNGTTAQFTGDGTVNGRNGFRFLLAAAVNTNGYYDGAGKVRVKIWEASSGNIIYDSQRGGPDDAVPTSILTGMLNIKR